MHDNCARTFGGKGNSDIFIGKSGVGESNVGVGGLGFGGLGAGGSGQLGFGGSGVGGLGVGGTGSVVVVEGHVGRMLGRFEEMGKSDHEHDEHRVHGHVSSVAIDFHPDNDDDTTMINNDVEPQVKSPTQTQQHYNPDRQRQQPIDNKHDRQKDNNLEQPRTTTTTHDMVGHWMRQESATSAK